MMNESSLAFWMITPPNNINKFISAVGRRWNGKVIVIACHDVTEERKKSGFTRECPDIDSLFVLDDLESPDSFVDEIQERYKNDIHCFFGIHREPAPYMFRLRKNYPKARIVAVSEKTAPDSGSFWMRIAKKAIGPVFYRRMIKKAEKCVDCIFVCSLHGMAEFRKYGWKKKNMYNFMYCDGIPCRPKENKPHNTVNFLYVGRFGYRMRGLDNLMKGFDQLTNENWTLTLIGGYGPQKSEVLSWVESKKNVFYGGRWNANEVQQKMQDYDIYICPCRQDSWNGQINQALCAGIGIITTDQAGSDELVSASGAGVVIPVGWKPLKQAVENVIYNPEIVNDWKKAASEYSHRISLDAIANYFCAILESESIDDADKHICTWIKEK